MGGGALRLFRFRGVPVELHWSLLLAFLFALRGGDNLVHDVLALLVIVLVHELGHAALVWRFKLKVQAIRLYIFGGECLHEQTFDRRQQVLIAWGGVLAQAVLYAAAAAVLALHLPLPGGLRAMLIAFASTNVAIAAFNLLPIRGLDGHTAWRLKHLFPRTRGSRPLARTGDKRIVSLVDDALDRARADAAAQRHAERRAKARRDRD